MMEKNQKKTKRNGVLWGIALGLCALNTQAQTDGQVLPEQVDQLGTPYRWDGQRG